MKLNRVIRAISLFLCGVLLLTVPSRASSYLDLESRQFLHIVFENCGDEPCFATLLSGEGAVLAIRAGNETHFKHERDSHMETEVWKAFCEYEDADGFCFTDRDWDLSETEDIFWGCFAPMRFKVLIYYPEREAFAVSGIYELESPAVLTVDLEEDLVELNGDIDASEN